MDGCSFTSRPVKREIMYPSMDAGNLFKISINKIDLGLDNMKKKILVPLKQIIKKNG